MITYTDKNGRRIQIKATLDQESNHMSSHAAVAEQSVYDLLLTIAQRDRSEMLTLPVRE